MNIAGKLRELRDKKELTQEEFARIIGISEKELQEYENVQKPVIPSIHILKQIAKFYKVRMEYLLDDEWTTEDYRYVVILYDKGGDTSKFHFTYKNREEAVSMVNSALKEGYGVYAYRYCSCDILDYFYEDE